MGSLVLGPHEARGQPADDEHASELQRNMIYVDDRTTSQVEHGSQVGLYSS